MTVLKGVAEIEMLCLNSRESFEDNKRFLRARMEKEENPVVRKLLEKDQAHLDRIQVQMATAREFLIMVRLREENGTGSVFTLSFLRVLWYDGSVFERMVARWKY